MENLGLLRDTLDVFFQPLGFHQQERSGIGFRSLSLSWRQTCPPCCYPWEHCGQQTAWLAGMWSPHSRISGNTLQGRMVGLVANTQDLYHIIRPWARSRGHRGQFWSMWVFYIATCHVWDAYRVSASSKWYRAPPPTWYPLMNILMTFIANIIISSEIYSSIEEASYVLMMYIIMNDYHYFTMHHVHARYAELQV